MTIKFWENREKEILAKTLFSETAETYANKVYRLGGDRKNNPTQIRKFFDEIVSYNSKLKQQLAKENTNRQEAFEKLLPFIYMIIPKVKYAEARGLVSREFTSMIEDCVANLKASEDLTVFVSFFEAFIGYYKFISESQKNSNRRSH